ncbi:MAG: CvpA family protein [Peptococcaceae bacterium]|nr:CvpA family protein [Peptococcaceae bacterium]
MNWFDILLLIVIGGSAFIGLKSGLVRGLSRFLGFILGFVAALNFYQPLADTLNLKWQLSTVIGDWLPFFGEDKKQALSGGQGDALFSGGPTGVLSGLGDSLANLFASGILDILCFVAIFWLVSWGVKFLGSLLATMAKLFFLGPIDRVGGAFLGAVNGGVLVLVLIGIMKSMEAPLSFASGSQDPGFLAEGIAGSVLAPFFTDILVILDVTLPGLGG